MREGDGDRVVGLEHYATVFGRSSGKYLFPPLYDHGFRSL